MGLRITQIQRDDQRRFFLKRNRAKATDKIASPAGIKLWFEISGSRKLGQHRLRTLERKTAAPSAQTSPREDGAPFATRRLAATNTNRTTSTWHQSLSPFPDASALSWRFCRRNFSPSDRSRLLPPFRIPPDLFHDLSPSHPYNPCPTSTCSLPFPPATRHFLLWRSPSNLHSPCCGPSPSELQSFSLRYRSRSSLPHDPSPLPSFRLWPHL